MPKRTQDMLEQCPEKAPSTRKPAEKKIKKDKPVRKRKAKVSKVAIYFKPLFENVMEIIFLNRKISQRGLYKKLEAIKNDGLY